MQRFRGPERLIYSLSHTTLHLPHELKETAKQVVRDGLAPSEGDALRTILLSATTLTKEEVVGNFHGRALALMNANPGMSYSAACSELGKRSGAKARAEAERQRKAAEKARKYQEQLRKREGGRDDEPEADAAKAE